jgi:hypothetical protein
MNINTIPIIIFSVLFLSIYLFLSIGNESDKLSMITPINELTNKEWGDKVFISATIMELDRVELYYKTMLIGKIPITSNHYRYYYNISDDSGSIILGFPTEYNVGDHINFTGHIKDSYLC